MGSPDIPGPGAHYKELPPSSIGAKIGTSERPMLHPNYGKQVPGPGAYDIRKPFVPELKEYEKTSNFPKMGIKYNVKKNTDTVPGPGAYDPYGSGILEKNSGPVIGTSRRPEPKFDNAPGPGYYNIKKESLAPKHSFGTAPKNNRIKPSDEPGPGSYNIPPAFGNVPKYLLPRQRSDSAI